MQKRRALVLVDEAARHPFLRSLPPHVRKAPLAASAPGLRWSEIGYGDMRDVVNTYCATFVAVTAFFY